MLIEINDDILEKYLFAYNSFEKAKTSDEFYNMYELRRNLCKEKDKLLQEFTEKVLEQCLISDSDDWIELSLDKELRKLDLSELVDGKPLTDEEICGTNFQRITGIDNRE